MRTCSAGLAAAAAFLVLIVAPDGAQELLGGRAPAVNGALEIGMDRPGADLFARSLPGGTVADCQDLCRVTSGCAAFSFDRMDGLQAPVCRIKEAVTPATPAPCCVSAVMGATAPPAAVSTPPVVPVPVVSAPVAPPSASPAPPPQYALPPAFASATIATTWQDSVALRDGFGRCLDLGQDGLVRANACTGAASQSIGLRAGGLSIGGRLVGPASVGSACRAWSAQSSARRYAVRVCRADVGPSSMILHEADGVRVIDATLGPAASIGAGAALTAGASGEALFEHIAATGQMRIIGRDLCLAVAPGDAQPGAPVYVDFCAAPAAGFDGSRAAPDGRARFEPVR
jgi:hypothetical protein